MAHVAFLLSIAVLLRCASHLVYSSRLLCFANITDAGTTRRTFLKGSRTFWNEGENLHQKTAWNVYSMHSSHHTLFRDKYLQYPSSWFSNDYTWTHAFWEAQSRGGRSEIFNFLTFLLPPFFSPFHFLFLFYSIPGPLTDGCKVS